MKIKLHRKAPAKLKRAFKDNERNFNKTARALGVNRGILHKLLVKGEEPAGEELRVKLFLPRHKRKPHTVKPASEPKPPIPVWRRWWNRREKIERDSMIYDKWEEMGKPDPKDQSGK